MGNAFIKDSARYNEDLITEDEFRACWELTDAEWNAIGGNIELLDQVHEELRQRIENGDAAREAARFAYPDVVRGLVSIARSELVSPRHRIEAARELRAVSGVIKEEAVPEHVSISINIGSRVVRCEGEVPTPPVNEVDAAFALAQRRHGDVIDLDSVYPPSMPLEMDDE
jgi:hypothetical protein